MGSSNDRHRPHTAGRADVSRSSHWMHRGGNSRSAASPRAPAIVLVVDDPISPPRAAGGFGWRLAARQGQAGELVREGGQVTAALVTAQDRRQSFEPVFSGLDTLGEVVGRHQPQIRQTDPII